MYEPAERLVFPNTMYSLRHCCSGRGRTVLKLIQTGETQIVLQVGENIFSQHCRNTTQGLLCEEKLNLWMLSVD